MPGWILESREPAMVLRVTDNVVKTIGRTARADFIVEAPLVSRLHCRLTTGKGDKLIVEDLGSTNGTLVNGQRIERVELQTGDVLTVGRVEFTVLPG
jgi:pSer/pThr/pTyr-binding forkhead associated (FHA) protein